jgi:hypothetical protein
MALHKKPTGHQVNRTPAPDADPRIQNYGSSSLPPGQGGPLTALGRNLRDSIDDPARDKVLAKGTAGRDDEIPADDSDLATLKSFDANDLPADGSLQRRSVPDGSYPLTPGADRRQQNPDAVFGGHVGARRRPAIRLSANGMKALGRGAQPVRKP